MRNLVLVIEQNSDFASSLRTILESKGFEVETAFSAEKASTMLMTRHFDVIFLDIDLWFSINSVIGELTQVTGKTRMILSSNKHSNSYILREAMGKGAFGCVHKPFIREEVMAMVKGTAEQIKEKGFNLLKCSMLIFGLLFLPLLPESSSAQELQGIPSYVQTPQTLVGWLKNEFKYRFEVINEWQDPQKTIDTKTGDCEDFAVLVSRVLSHLGISNDILVVNFEGLEVAHAVCAWRDKEGKYSFISNRKLYRTGERELEDAIRKYYPDSKSIMFSDTNMQCIEVIYI